MITIYIVRELSPFNLILREGEDGSEWPPSRRPGQGWKGSRSSLEYVVNCITWAFFGGKREAKRETRNSIRFGVQLR